MCRPGGEVRICPLVTLSFREYPVLGRLADTVRGTGCGVGFPESRLPFIPGAHRLMVIRKPEQASPGPPLTVHRAVNRCFGRSEACANGLWDR